MLIAACDPQRYESLGVIGHHASCQENLLTVAATLDLGTICVPQSVNLFMHIPVGADGSLTWKAARSRPGDSVTFRADLDVIVILSACPQDIVPINNLVPGPLALERLDALQP